MALGHNSFILKKGGTVWGAGDNRYGQLGLGDSGDGTERSIFTEIGINNVKQVRYGSDYTVVLKKDGALWVCGGNKYGQLGLGDSGSGTERRTFTKVDIEDVKDISCGGYHTFLVKNDGTLWSCGYNHTGQLGLGDNGIGTERVLFTKVNIDDVQSVYCGDRHTAILKKDGTVWACGHNLQGQLGLGDNESRNIFTKVDIEDVKQICCGNLHTTILKNDETVWVCGHNLHGQLGLGDNESRNIFTQTSISNIKYVCCGGYSTIALDGSWDILVTGSNGNGAIGLGDTSKSNVFNRISFGNISKIACGHEHMFILKEDGSVMTTGRNDYGQLGLGHNNHVKTFTNVDITGVEWLWDDYEIKVFKGLINYSGKYFRLNESRLIEEVNIITEQDFMSNGMDSPLDLITPDINGNRPIDLLPDEFEIRVYKNISDSIKAIITEESYNPIDDLDDTFEILTYSEEDSDKQLNVNALPKDNQLVVPTEDIKLNSIENIHQTKVSIKGNDGFVKIVVSCDSGTTWKTFKDGAWSDVALDKAVIRKMGMSNVEMESITMEKWNEIINAENKLIRFAFLLGKNNVDSICDVDEISLIVDMRGTWKSSNYGTDYTYKYPNNMLLQVEIKNNGDYKINYGGRKG